MIIYTLDLSLPRAHGEIDPGCHRYTVRGQPPKYPYAQMQRGDRFVLIADDETARRRASVAAYAYARLHPGVKFKAQWQGLVSEYWITRVA